METHHDDRDGTMVVTAYAVEELAEVTPEDAEKLFDSSGAKPFRLKCPSGRVLTLKVNSPEQLWKEVFRQAPFEEAIRNGIISPHPTDPNKFISNIFERRRRH
jgi:hypothetical protein